MRHTATYLEMTSPADLVPADPRPDVVLTSLADDPALARDVIERVGGPYHWGTNHWSDDRWAAHLSDPAVHPWLIAKGDEPAGVAVHKVHSPTEVEVLTFGLLPEHVGTGIGGHALTLTLRRAWELLPGVTRVWLHTSTLDHPNALPNYRKRGLRPYRVEERDTET
ncbi:GNAT family N-acetyltransferase [Actinomadura kijaniata]|uniref:GNAT family N-acetyltransferase n=1 Tax=Actinomadura kijaniata TaxID=46161 RepID=UPI00082C6C29|nr:GNAT family N-acetyltransferase [Actinomadura kijaniata]